MINHRWSAQEEGVGCSEQQVFPSVKNQGYQTSTLGGLQQGAWRRGPAHSQTINFAPMARKVVNLPGLLKTKGLNLIEERAIYENGPTSNRWCKASKRGCDQRKKMDRVP